MAFNLSACPSGWTEYTAAYGRFIRGIDKSGTNIDPDGQRALGNMQEDEFESHTHSTNSGSDRDNTSPYNRVAMGAYNIISGPSIGATGGDETRPKNVALLYCEKD